ncbi:MAG: isocitrate/isopropylmalate dehydrogenase family protein [Candidatus Lokiarchaeota archaeon]|nr:isocitrate/isopropylmalate dehydrogenase family protein [Candidatus Lokiarchaeota archaeon]MBD3199462.1 isocitrate/isopropylmalate dehydrogenase family protein [Candidatus Lokiarchaeota archaeon]
MSDNIEKAKQHFDALIKQQLERVEKLKAEVDWIDYSKLNPLIIGIIGGDGIGPEISKHAHMILRFLLKDEIEKSGIILRDINGLTIENRAKVNKAVPLEVLEEIKKCHVLLKGPTTTPRKGDKWPNIESANVALRRALDLFANVRPIQIPEKEINWIFFRENTEGTYLLGSKGINVTENLSIDFKVITSQGAHRIIELAFEYAHKNGINKVSVVTKANVVKATDGKFLAIAQQVADKYPDIELDDWYIDIITAKLIDPLRQSKFKIFVAPNLYGDIITDEAAQIQGGVGTAGSANIGKRYAMFEAIHGSAPRMIDEGREKYADPSSLLRAIVMMLEHVGYIDKARKLEKALDICTLYEKKIIITGRSDGATGKEFAEYVINTLKKPSLETLWNFFH